MVEIIEKIVNEKEKLEKRDQVDRDALHALFAYIEELKNWVSEEKVLTNLPEENLIS